MVIGVENNIVRTHQEMFGILRVCLAKLNNTVELKNERGTKYTARTGKFSVSEDNADLGLNKSDILLNVSQ